VSRRLLIAAEPGEWRVALVEGGALLEFRLVRLVGGSRVGELFLGRVVRGLPALRAVLVDIGLARPAHLSLDDALSKSQSAALHEGAGITVQVKRDPRADKAAGVTMRLRLRGTYLDWLPTRPGVRVDLLEEHDRERVAALLSRAMQQGEGIAARPSAALVSETELQSEVAVLRARWAAIDEKRRAAEPPALLEAVDPIAEFLRELVDGVDAVVIDDSVAFGMVRLSLARERPALLDRLQRHRGVGSLFQSEGIADAVAALTARRVPLPGGGAVEIAPTAAAVLIDVDSGGLAQEQHLGDEALLTLNLAAAIVIARQIRLRGLAGALVVDFVALARKEHRTRLLESFRSALRSEVPEAQLLGWTRLGHVELTRPRRRAALHEVVFETDAEGQRSKTPITVALEALAAASSVAEAERMHRILLRVHPRVAAVLKGEAAAVLGSLEARSGGRIELAVEPSRAQESFAIERG